MQHLSGSVRALCLIPSARNNHVCAHICTCGYRCASHVHVWRPGASSFRELNCLVVCWVCICVCVSVYVCMSVECVSVHTHDPSVKVRGQVWVLAWVCTQAGRHGHKCLCCLSPLLADYESVSLTYSTGLLSWAVWESPCLCLPALGS